MKNIYGVNNSGNNMKTIPNRRASYGHKELAMLFFPDIQPKSASATLKRWIQRDEELICELKKAGYSEGQRVYSPLQTSILFDHLGEPETFQVK